MASGRVGAGCKGNKKREEVRILYSIRDSYFFEIIFGMVAISTYMGMK